MFFELLSVLITIVYCLADDVDRTPWGDLESESEEESEEEEESDEEEKKAPDESGFVTPAERYVLEKEVLSCFRI